MSEVSRERVQRMLAFQPVDQVPLEYHPCWRGLYEYGERFRDLVRSLPGDFEDFSNYPTPVLTPDLLDEHGEYHEFRTDEWGVQWEYRIFQMSGHPHKGPLEDLANYPAYRMPQPKYQTPQDFAALQDHVKTVQQSGYCKMGFYGIFERLHELCGFENALMEIWEDSPEIHAVADDIVGQFEKEIGALLEAGVDAVQFGDDFGANQAMLMDPELWRAFFKPRYERLFRPILDAGKKIFFHSCGYVEPILRDFADMGVHAIWPQLAAYPMEEFARKLRDYRLACAIHIDRAGIMTRGKPEDVRNAVKRAAEAFDITNGGAWFYVEIDNGFPFENIQALFESIAPYRK
ncbi:MAG TPA: hypothetical protein IAC17_03390 [Candidatus Faecousia faecipullorum]|nr:hypothetical protein [Candidatus Faecousia faecipullorum]